MRSKPAARGIARPFMTARWTNLVLVNYRVPETWLTPYVPPGAWLDTPDDEPESHLISLVAFHFSETRVLGVPLPTAGHFPELNLRFYVRDEHRRATTFMKEYVPVPLVALGARLLYHQPYELATIAHRLTMRDGRVESYTRFRQGANSGEIRISARDEPVIPAEGTIEHFIKEHYWGADTAPDGGALWYRVEHPRWEIWPVESATVDFDPGALLGPPWNTLDWDAARHSVQLARGSAVALSTPREALEIAARGRWG